MQNLISLYNPPNLCWWAKLPNYKDITTFFQLYQPKLLLGLILYKDITTFFKLYLDSLQGHYHFSILPAQKTIIGLNSM